MYILGFGPLSAMGPGPAHMLPYPQGRHWLAGGGGLVGAKETRELQMDKRRVHQVPSSEFETACSTQQTVLNKDNARAQGRYEPLSASSSCSFTYFFFLSYYGMSLTGRIRYGSSYLKTESYYLEKLKKTICNFLYGYIVNRETNLMNLINT